ncbi:MAG TPA: hypothetical protein VJ861_07600 [Treponemataceae bacterium]|nr:hypothetical protein [Treponemataceae bacterium]
MKQKTLFSLLLFCSVFFFNFEISTEERDFPLGLDLDAALLARISGLFEREDPTSIYNFQVYDEEVEFILDGSWEAGLVTSTSLNFSPKGSTFSFSPPLFTQSVDLMSWVFINKTWYFESNFTEGFTKNTLAAGYIGTEDTTVKHVRIGNTGITFPSIYPFISIGGGNAQTPGLSASFGGNKWNADTIIRYDTASNNELYLSGMNEISDTIIPMTAVLKGKWFILPDVPITGSISMYVEDNSGNIQDDKGRKWRELNLSEYTISALTGVIELQKPALASVAIIHENSTNTTGITQFITKENQWFLEQFKTDGANLYFPYDLTEETEIIENLMIDLEGKKALLLRKNGYFSPFEIQNRYEISAESATPIYRESNMEAQGYQIVPYSDSYSSLHTSGSIESIRNPSARYPLLSEFPRFYLPSFGGFTPDTDLCIRTREFRNIQSISLGSDVINGTIMVYRDGTSDFKFTFDDQNGILELDRSPRSGEQIKITWKKTDESQRNGALIAAAGIQWNILPKLDLRSAIALAWNISPSAWTDSSSSSPGTTTVAASATWKGSQLNISSAYALELTVPDTTGYYRIEGMEKAPQTRYPEASWYRKISENIIPDLNDAKITEGNPVLTGQGKISPSPSGAILVVNESSVSGDILAIQCELPQTQIPSNGPYWSGAEILSGTKGGIDFEGISSFSISLKNTDSIGSDPEYDIYIQAGVFDSPFYEDSTKIKTWKIPEIEQPQAGMNWTVLTIHLSATDRGQIGKPGNIRLLVVPKDTVSDFPVRVRLQSGPMEFSGSGFTPGEDFFTYPESSISINEESGGIGDALVVSEPDTVGRFNVGGKNRILATQFTPAKDTTTIAISRIIPEIPLSNYRTFSFFIRPETLPLNEGAQDKPMLEVSLEGRATNDSGYSVSLGDREKNEFIPVLAVSIATTALQAGKWQKITVDKTTGTVFLNDQPLPPSLFTIVQNSSVLRVTKISLAMKNWEKPTGSNPLYAYTIYADEFFLSDPIPAWNMQNENVLTYKKNGSILNFGPTPIISNPFVELRLRNALDPTSQEIDISSSGFGGFKIFGASVEGSLSGSNSAPHVIETQSHRLIVPVGIFEISEVFSTRFADLQMYRNNKLSISGILITSIDATNEQTGNTEKQGITLSLKPQLPQGKNNNFKLETQLIANQKYRSDPHNINAGNWTDIWLDSAMGLFSQGLSDATERNTMQSVTSAWIRKNAKDQKLFWNGIQIQLDAKNLYVNGTGAKVTESSTIAIPFSLFKSSVTGTWLRSASRLTPEINGGTYLDDIDYIFASIKKQNWFYSILPIHDLFADTFKTDVLNSNTDSFLFVNRYTVIWKRPSPGLFRDLFIPSSMEFSTSRNTETSLEYQKDSWSASVKAGFSALNIAGTKGIIPFFTWYEQDELSQLYAWTSTWGKGYFIWNLDTWQSLTLFLIKDGSIAAENAFHYDSPQISGKNETLRNTVRLMWKRKGEKTPASQLVSNWYKGSISNLREDSIVFTINYTDAMKVTTSYLRLLQLNLGKKGSIKISGSADVFHTRETGLSLGFSLGIGGKLTF